MDAQRRNKLSPDIKKTNEIITAARTAATWKAPQPCNSGFFLHFPLWLIGVPIFFDFLRIESATKFFVGQIFIVDTESSLQKRTTSFSSRLPLEIFDCFKIFFRIHQQRWSGAHSHCPFVEGFRISRIIRLSLQNHVTEILIITDMGGLQLSNVVIFAGAIPFNDFMPDGIDKCDEV